MRDLVGKLLGGHLDVTEAAQADLLSDRPDEALKPGLAVFEGEGLHARAMQTRRHSVPILLILGSPMNQDDRDAAGRGFVGSAAGASDST